MNVKKPKHYMEQCRLTLFNRSLIILSLIKLQIKEARSAQEEDGRSQQLGPRQPDMSHFSGAAVRVTSKLMM